MEDKEYEAPANTHHIGFWADMALVAQIEAVAARISTEQGIPVSRSAALRMLVTQGLERWEKK